MAEATVFFVVPDAFFCGVAVARGARAGLMCLAAALAGGLVGGAVVHQMAVRRPQDAMAIVGAVPGVTERVRQRVRSHLPGGTAAMALGGFTFLPYKAYALESGLGGWPLSGFLAQSLGARATRFLSTLGLTLLAAALLRRWRPGLSPGSLVAIHFGFWSAIYAAYFIAVVPRL